MAYVLWFQSTSKIAANGFSRRVKLLLGGVTGRRAVLQEGGASAMCVGCGVQGVDSGAFEIKRESNVP